jgi:uncharacterized RDD family membrane protein YckC
MDVYIPTIPQESNIPSQGVGFWVRVGAQAIDLVLHYLIALLTGVTIGFLIGVVALMTGTPVAGLTARLGGSRLLDTLLALAGYIFYHTLCEGLHGATLGKLICGIQVRMVDGKTAGMGAAFLRSLALLVDELFFGLVAVGSMSSSPLKQRLGDKWAKTIVVRRGTRNPASLEAWPSGWKFVLAFALGCGLDAICLAIPMVARLF